MFFCILVRIYCHNIPTWTPYRGYHGVTEVAKSDGIAKGINSCINRKRLVILRHLQTPWSWDAETLFRGSFFRHFLALPTLKKVGFQGAAS